MKTQTLVLSGLLLSLGAAAMPAAGQIVVDRRIQEIAIVPNSSGTNDVHVIWTAGLETTASSLDLSTGVLLFKNNNFEVPIGSLSTQLNTQFADVGFCIAGGCAGGCGTGFIDGVLNTLLCLHDPPTCDACQCECQFPWITSSFPDVPLEPGDTLTAEVVAMSGAIIEPPGDNNVKTATFDGDGVFWNHRLRSVHATPASAPGFFDVHVEFDMLTKADSEMLITPIIILLDNGQALSQFDACGNDPWIISPDNPCTNIGPCPDAQFCASSSCAGTGIAHHCEPFAAAEPGFPLPGCGCLSESVAFIIPNVQFIPDRDDEVLLVPAPGALPTLPGFEEDDSMRLCPSDINADGSVGVGDLLQLLAAWGPCPGCPEDLNADGIVGVADLLKLLAEWGDCL